MGDELGSVRQFFSPRTEVGQQWEKVSLASMLRVILFAATIFYFFALGGLMASAQDAALSPTKIVQVRCGAVTLTIAQFPGVTTSEYCEEKHLFILGYCHSFQAFELTVRTKEKTDLYYDFHCSPTAYATRTACWDFPGTLHLRVQYESTIEEWNCPS